jgi:hypothetical protein
MFSIRPRNHCAVTCLVFQIGHQDDQHGGQVDFIGRSQIEPIHAWHAECGHLRDDQDRVAALEADRQAKLLSVRKMRIICNFPTSYVREKTC